MPYRIRTAEINDVQALIELLPHMTSRPESSGARMPSLAQAKDILHSILSSSSVHLLVAETETCELAGSATLVVVPNFTYTGRPWSTIENIVVHPQHRRQKLGSMLVEKAVEIARLSGCYKVQLISGDKAEQVKFYESLGFQSDRYIAHRLYL